MKKLLTCVVALALVLSLTVGAQATVLKVGSRGSAVRQLQQALKDLDYGDIAVDGVYGEKTAEVVARYQMNNGLKADGKAGPRTLAKLFGSSTINNNPTSDGKLRPGSTGPAVREVQTLLNKHGYSVGRVDGTYGPKTEAAVRLFQSYNGLAVDGVVGDTTLAALRSANPVQYSVPVQYPKLRRGDYGDPVKKLQTRLAALGYYKGTVSGYYSASTEEAVINFQRDKGLRVDGIAGQQTQTVLYGK
ncbi:MAG: peptidoglycan-binding protein [Clostridia bacterium]|nr:peptidoglycan-binding protein [Clostridia bacterium]